MEREFGAEVVWLPFDLHPEIPDEGVDLSAQSEKRRRYFAQFDELAAEAGLPFVLPTRLPRTRLALEAAEHVRQKQTGAFDAFHRALFGAYWARGLDIGRREVVLDLAEEAGADRAAAAAALTGRTMADDVDASTRRAMELGVSGTPGWLMDGRFLVPGTQARETFAAVITRMRRRAAERASGEGSTGEPQAGHEASG